VSAEAAVAAGRAAAESLMTDTCTIRRRTGAKATDPNTGQVTDVMAVVYAGRCRVQTRALSVQEAGAGEAQWPIAPVELQLPMSVTGLRTGDFATVDSAALDPDLVGRVFRITAPFHKSHATARRLPCTEGGPDD